MTDISDQYTPQLPFPIFRLSSIDDRFMLYDVDLVTWLRREHHILGVLTGTLPHFPQQNVFLGLPLQLMPEEARLLVIKGIAYIVDDVNRHFDLERSNSTANRHDYMIALREEGQRVAEFAMKRKQASKDHAKKRGDAQDDGQGQDDKRPQEYPPTNGNRAAEAGSLFEPPQVNVPGIKNADLAEHGPTKAWPVTPTTSFSLLPRPQASGSMRLPEVHEPTFAVFQYLHERGYYMSPGLRFGCQLMAYPGDPLRYHSHFLAVGAAWDEPIDLLDLIGGGRLGTGVKKGYLLGGPQPRSDGTSDTRVFCIEWGGM